MVENVFEKLVDLFESNGAQFRSLEHEACGKTSLSVSEIRGTELDKVQKLWF